MDILQATYRNPRPRLHFPVSSHPVEMKRIQPGSPRRGTWRAIIAAQEFGLVVVIALVMGALTWFGGDKSQNRRVDIPVGAEVSRNADFILVKNGARTTMYARDGGWEIAEHNGAPRILRRSDVTETIQTRPLPTDAAIEEDNDSIVVTISGERATYPVADGWKLDITDDGDPQLAQRRRVSKLQDVTDAPQDGSIVTRAGQILLRRADGDIWYPQRVGWRIVEEDEQPRFLIGSAVVNRFFEKENLVLLMTKASYFAVIAVGMTAIIVLGGIDLSVGSIYAVAAIVGALALQQLDPASTTWATVPVALLVCGAVGSLLGMVNGAMIVGLRLHPFIITLGTMAIYRGLVLLMTGGRTVSELPESIQRGFFKAEFFGVYPTLTIIMIITAAVGMFVLRRTVLGRRIYAIGGNETAAKYAGIPVGRVKLVAYTIGGLLAGLSACMEVGYNATASVGAGQGYELNVIAAAVIGGASLSGGRGSAIGAVLGAILVSLIDNAMVILDINQNYNQIVMGSAIVVAVAVERARRGADAR